jgi:DNA modification methylase
MKSLPRNQVIFGDVRKVMAELPADSVDCVISSPPYFLLRDYGMHDQIGLEETVEGWVNELQLVMRGVARVLKPTGALWLNVGDSYSRHARYGAPPKGMLCAPERLLLALADDGWLVRNKVIWAKPNPMPASVRDRLNTTYEVVYFLVRSPSYAFDLDAIRVPHRSVGRKRPRSTPNPLPTARPSWAGPLAGSNSGLTRLKASGLVGNPRGRNPGDVWNIGTHGFRGAHFATFPEQLVDRPILATCPEAVCTGCQKVMRREQICSCGGTIKPGVVLDPFMGSGTVAVAAERLGRDWLGIELNPAYVRLAEERIAQARTNRNNGTERRHAA